MRGAFLIDSMFHFFFTSLSGNKGLCGVPSLPACPFFWEKGNLSTGGKVAIGLACGIFLIVLLLLIYIFCIRRGRHDYDFAPTQDLTSISAIAAKRNRYQRQKSLMFLEMETPNSNGLPVTSNLRSSPPDRNVLK